MEWISRQPNTLFVGQTVGGPGTFMYQTLRDCPKERCWEFPVNESLQMQFTIGLALAGYIPISVYPRQNFLLLATADMANMLDKIPDISNGTINPHVIIRVASGPYKPVHPGHQHIGNYADAFRKMFKHIEVIELDEPEDVLPFYKRAIQNPGQYLLIEDGNNYNDK